VADAMRELIEKCRQQGAKAERDRIATELCAGCLCIKEAAIQPNNIECANNCKAHWLEYFGTEVQE
jgi:hypothetical protein